jgi:outer membrane protein assembly factor BamB
MKLALPLLLLTATVAALKAQNQSAALGPAVRPFLEKNCIGCHNTGMPSGNVDMQQLLGAPNSLGTAHDTWDDIAFQIRSGLMPPEGAPKPAKADADAALELISRAVAAAPRGSQAAAPQAPGGPSTKDWVTFSYDGERTGWARGETKLTKETAPSLTLKWRLQTDTKPDPGNKYSTVTDPLVVNIVPTREGPKRMVYVGSHDNSVYAIDADKGTVVWMRAYPNAVPPKVPQTGQCPNNMNATPVIDPKSGILYFLPNDGKLRGVSIVDGEDRFPATAVVPPYTRNFSLNLVNGVIFTSTTRGCQREVSEIVGINVVDPQHTISHFYTSTGKGSGVWGRGGLVETPFGILGQTADGAYDPAAGRWGSSIVGLNNLGRLTDSFTPADQFDLDARDFDLGSSGPVVFPYGGRTLVALSGKEGKIYLLDAKNLGGKDHHTPLYLSPRWSNDAGLFSFNGMWSVLSTYVDKQGRRWILAPFYGPVAKDTVGMFWKQHGATVNGELMAFTVERPADRPALVPQWVSADLDLPGIAVVASDVIFVLANGDRASTPPSGGGRGGGNGGGAAGPGRGGAGGGRGGGAQAAQYDVDAPGADRDEAWLASQRRPFEQGGQKGGTRFAGGRDTTHAVLYALDPETGDELYSSGDAIDSWSHYGGLALSDGNIYLSTWDARVYAFGLAK